MRTHLDCLPCFVTHVLEAVRMTTDDEQVHQKVLREAMCLGCSMDLSDSPPARAQKIHRFIHEATGVRDPYRDVKRRFNEFALAMYPNLKELVESSDDPFETAVRLAIAGNIIDFGVNSEIEQSRVEGAIAESLTEPLDAEALDRLLIEQLPRRKVTFAVRGKPILNDATIEDARMAGLTELVDVITSGSDAPGVILEDCSKKFVRRFEKADLVIAKGQGNYETLSGVEKNIFFMLRPKCRVLAEHLSRDIGSLVLAYKLETKAA